MKIISLILSLFMLCSCGAVQSSKEATVYTTFYAMYDFTKEIAGDKLNVVELVPSGGGPHDFEPTATDIAKITKSKALIYCRSVDTYIDGICETAQKSGVKILDTCKDIEIMENSDPHVWLDPQNALIQYTEIADLLSEIDPQNSGYYQERLEAVKAKINDIDTRIDNIKNSLTDKKDIIVTHGAYGYLCRRMGVNAHSIEQGFGESSSPTAKHMAEIIDFAKEKDIKIVFSQKNESDKSAQSVVEEIGGEISLLDPFEADTQSGNYFDVMQGNLDAIEKALK